MYVLIFTSSFVDPPAPEEGLLEASNRIRDLPAAFRWISVVRIEDKLNGAILCRLLKPAAPLPTTALLPNSPLALDPSTALEEEGKV